MNVFYIFKTINAFAKYSILFMFSNKEDVLGGYIIFLFLRVCDGFYLFIYFLSKFSFGLNKKLHKV